MSSSQVAGGIAGMDPDKVLDLARALEEGADRLRTCRARLEAALAPLGHEVPHELGTVGAWAQEQAGAVRGQAQAIRAADTIKLVLSLFGFGGFGPLVPLPAARFPTEAEAAAAGRQLAERYRESFDEPDRLLALTEALERYGTDPVFARAFVEAFGAGNLVEVPRVIQAIEFQGSFMGFGPQGAHYRLDIDWTEEQVDARALLAVFSGVLATATRGGLSREVEKAIANDEDVVAVSWLLSQGEFSTSFLLDAFQAGVVRRIGEESRARSAPFGDWLDEGFPLGAMGGSGLSLDPKAEILSALARNPEAAGLAATMEFGTPVTVVDLVGREVRVTNAADLLLDHGFYDDGGEALGEMLATAVRDIHRVDRHAAGNLTERIIHAVVLGREEIDRAVRGLSTVLAEFFVVDLHAVAGRNSFDDPNKDGDRFVGYMDGDELWLPVDHLHRLIQEVSADDVARGRLFPVVAVHQARVARDHAGGPDELWARELGAFTQVLVNANDDNAIRDEAARQKRQADVLAVFDGALGMIPMGGRFVSFAVGQGTRVIKDELISSRDVNASNFEFKQRAIHALDGLLVAGYFERGLLGPRDEVMAEAAAATRGDSDAIFFVDGHLLPYGDMSPAQRVAFDEWLRTSTRVSTVVGPAFERAHDPMAIRDKDN